MLPNNDAVAVFFYIFTLHGVNFNFAQDKVEIGCCSSLVANVNELAGNSGPGRVGLATFVAVALDSLPLVFRLHRRVGAAPVLDSGRRLQLFRNENRQILAVFFTTTKTTTTNAETKK